MSHERILVSLDFADKDRFNIVEKQESGVNDPSTFTTFSMGTFTAGKVDIKHVSGQYVRINNNPYTTYEEENSPMVDLDHIKSLFVLPPIKLTSADTLSVNATMRPYVYGVTEDNPFRSLFPSIDHMHDDLRLATCGLVCFDQNIWLIADILLTNTKVFAVYERLPFGRTAENYYASFSAAIPIYTRKNQNDFLNFSIRFDLIKKSITWLVDNEIKYTIDKVGYKPEQTECICCDFGGKEKLVFPEQLEIAVGTMTILDWYPCARHLDTDRNIEYTTPEQLPLVRLSKHSDNPQILQYINCRSSEHEVKFFDESGKKENKIFGQGCILDVKRIIISSNNILE
ncbi:unnamed protein product [Didymodactylos carnosus]|uniref:Uncharacterized protein n=1 Tax=Didymodactylos carnosus TaxID=1234261 RepID=A0A815GLR8_9BILA|nr:unnamed protein product [Didymodactylos carnosus]CAF4201082.1 unnamed protein product [Didymodactylos carnosus]